MSITAVAIAVFVGFISPPAPLDSTTWQLTMRPVAVTARGLKDVGTTQTSIDSTALHENPARSIAEVLAENSSIFIKSYGRGTLATASLRGTSAAHTRILWNGLELSSPMLGSVDLSTIPSYLIDAATVYHGASSVGIVSGGLGGAVALTSDTPQNKGWNLRFVQGLGSFRTADELLRVDFSNAHVSSSTRLAYGYSRNDFRYTNYYKRTNLKYDNSGNILSWDYPTERNSGGGWNDLHLLEELSVALPHDNSLSINAWYSDLRRGVPMLNVSYRNADDYSNVQHDRTLRSSLGWQKLNPQYKASASIGYIHSSLSYRYSHNIANGESVRMIDSGNTINTLSANAQGEYYVGKWLFGLTLSARQDYVRSTDYRHNTAADSTSGYKSGRFTADGAVTVKWRPIERLSVGTILREEVVGGKASEPIPAIFIDFVLSKRGNVALKASATRNYRFPTLNDLYYKPGGNPSLRPETGFTYDAGVEFAHAMRHATVSGSLTGFDSYIRNWILWLPTFNGFWSPVNVRRVHSYGTELKLGTMIDLGKGVTLKADGNFAWTPSINEGDAQSWSDEARGKQLVYVPRYTASLTATLSWRGWGFQYRWNYYDKRYTTSSNDTASPLGTLPVYFMSDVSLSKQWVRTWGNLSLKFTINNLLNEEYETVLSRPMPRQNYYFTLEFAPRIGRH